MFNKYDKSNRKTKYGHICFIIDISEDKQKYICLGGNQSNKITIHKYYKNKKINLKDGYLKIEGIYWPKEIKIEDSYIIK